jgi:hypothetical protein
VGLERMHNCGAIFVLSSFQNAGIFRRRNAPSAGIS